MKVWIDGQVREPENARISVMDHGLLYGDGVFEGLRVYNGRVWRIDRHLERLQGSARALGLEIPGGLGRVRAVILETVAAFLEPETEATGGQAYIRLLVTRGEGPLGIDPFSCKEPRLICIVAALDLFPPDSLERGISLITSSFRRANPDVLDPGVKSLNYLTSVLAKREARLAGADDSILLNDRGRVAEASAANLFAVKRGRVLTPPVEEGALDGVTRETILELAREQGLHCSEQALTRTHLLAADEIFLTGTGARLVPVRSLDSVEIPGPVPGPITRQLDASFRERVSREV